MVFTETVRLAIPTSQEMAELENNVMNLERLASRRSVASSEIQNSITETNPVLPSALTRRRRNSALSRGVQSTDFARQRVNGASRSSASPVSGLASSSFQKLQTEVNELKNFNSKMSEAFGFVINPTGTIASRAMSLGAGIPGVGFAASLVPLIYQMIVAQHGSGGIFDVSKQTLDNTRTFIGLEREEVINGGDILFLGNVALKQGIPSGITSNTQDLRDGLRRYTLQTNQFGR